MSFPSKLPPLDIKTEVPVSESCNCCETIICCIPRRRTPKVCPKHDVPDSPEVKKTDEKAHFKARDILYGS